MPVLLYASSHAFKCSCENIEMLKMNESDVDKILKKEKIKLEDVLIGTIDENSNFIYQLKNEVNKK